MVDFPKNQFNIDAKKLAIIDFNNGGGFTGSVDKEYVHIDDILIYTITLKNTGNVVASDVVFREKVTVRGNIVPGSVYVNNIQQGVADPTFKKGIIVGDIKPNEVSIIKYKFKLEEIPKDNKIKLVGKINFQYISDLGNVEGYGESNVVVSTLNIAIIEFENIEFNQRFINNSIDINNPITYKVYLKNIGNIIANNILLEDKLNDDISLFLNSINVNGKIGYGLVNNNKLNIPVGVLSPNEVCIVEFSININDIPTENFIKSSFKLTYSYIDNPKDYHISEAMKLNENIIPISNVNLANENFTLKASKESIDKDEDILYTVTIRNSGNIPAYDVILKNILPDYTEIVDNSIYINGQLKAKSYINNDVIIGIIGCEEILTINYKVKIKNGFVNSIINNQCNIKYSYNGVHGEVLSSMAKSNTVSTLIKSVCIEEGLDGFSKLSDKAFVRLNEEITYTLKIRNSGNIDAYNLIVKDKICEGLCFVQGSVLVKGVNIKGCNIESGIIIEKLEPKEIIVIKYKAVTRKMPTIRCVSSSATLEYEYYVSQNSNIRKSISSNKCSINIDDVNFKESNINIICNKKYAKVGEKVNYTITIINTGTIVANEALLNLQIPSESTLIKDSISIDNKFLNNLNILDKIPLGNILPKQGMDVRYSLRINKLPNNNIISSKVILNFLEDINDGKGSCIRSISKNCPNINIDYVNLEIQKTSNNEYSSLGEVIDYKVLIFNKGNLDLKDILLRDSLSSELEFIQGTVKVDNEFLSENIINGIRIDFIGKKSYKVIEFKAKIISNPSRGKILTKSIARYNYFLSEDKEQLIGRTESEENIVNVKKVNVIINKICNAKEVSLNEEVEYKLILENNGEIDVSGFIFRENIPKELKFINNSFTLNDMRINGVNIKSGIRIGNIKKDQKVEIKFKAKVIKEDYSNAIYSESYGEYNYKLTPNGILKKGICKIQTNKIRILNNITKDLVLEELCELAEYPYIIENINNIRASIEISDSYIRKTRTGFTGEEIGRSYKLIINGILTQIIDFDVRTISGIRRDTAEFKKKFSSFIVLSNNYEVSEHIDIRTNIEDILYNRIDNHNISTRVIVLFKANII